jgi:hypothetical protein
MEVMQLGNNLVYVGAGLALAIALLAAAGVAFRRRAPIESARVGLYALFA